MSFHILDAVKGYLTPDLISKISLSLGESESGVSKALSGIAPVILSGFVTKTNSGNDVAKDILGIVKDAYKESGTGRIENLIGEGESLLTKGLNLTQALFGDKLKSLLSAIAPFAGIKDSSVSSLFSMICLLIAGLLGKYVTDMNMSSSSLSSFLHGQKTSIMSMLPAGLSGITSLLALSEVGQTFKTDTKKSFRDKSEIMHIAKRGTNWLLRILILVLVVSAIWYFAAKGCNKEETITTEESR